MNQIIEYLPFLIPLVIIQLGLAITALVHVLKHDRYNFGNRALWVVLVLVFQLIGPILYFTIGRGDK